MKKRNLFVVIWAFIISLNFCACANENKEIESESVEIVESVAENANELQEQGVAETVLEKESVEAVQEGESGENLSGPQSVGEWAASLDTTEPKLTIWNDITKEGTLLENGQIVTLKEGDMLTVCMKKEYDGIRIYADLEGDEFDIKGKDTYRRFEFYKEFTYETLFNFDITIDDIVYPFSVTLISENAVNSPDAAQKEILSGKEWAATLEFDEPKLLVWNDETGTREVIDEGGEYHMQEGDVLAAYHGEALWLSNVEPFEFCTGITPGIPYSRIEYALSQESQTINMGLEFWNMSIEESEEFTYYFTITTP